jgi:CRISPR-associated protein Cas5t
MISLRVEAPYASFRTSFARSYAETYPLPPPATIYGMLLSLVGERQRRAHLHVRLSIGFTRTPRLSTVLKRLSRYKYGVPSKQAKLGNAPDYVEVLCGIECVVLVDSASESANITLEERLSIALDSPERIERTGIVCLGLSNDMVDVRRVSAVVSEDHIEWLTLDGHGSLELPVWVDHVGSADTRWRRFRLVPSNNDETASDRWISILTPIEIDRADERARNHVGS